MFKKYIHVERLGNSEVENIHLGICYIYPKLDGANGSIWFEDGEIKCASRNNVLSEDKDNAGFYKYVQTHKENLLKYFTMCPEDILYGEWLVPHNIKHYKEDAWRKFYVFDVFNKTENKFLRPLIWELLIKKIAQLPVVEIHTCLPNPTIEQLDEARKTCKFLIEEEGYSEGIVIKNYDFVNKYGRTAWAKVIHEDFSHKKEKLKRLRNAEDVENKITIEYCTKEFVLKELAKIELETGGWDRKLIPRVISTVVSTLIKEEMWDIIKKYKNPTVDFSILFKCLRDQIIKVLTEEGKI